MGKITNLYDIHSNEYVGQLFLIDEQNQRYNYINKTNQSIGYAVTNGNNVIVRNHSNQDLFMGQFNGNRINLRNLKGEFVLYGMRLN